MSLKTDFIEYVEEVRKTTPLPEHLEEYWSKFKEVGKDGKNVKFTENGKKVLAFLQTTYTEENPFKSKEVAELMMVSSRAVSGAMRKLVTDGYVEKVSEDPVVYAITTKGKNINLNED